MSAENNEMAKPDREAEMRRISMLVKYNLDRTIKSQALVGGGGQQPNQKIALERLDKTIKFTIIAQCLKINFLERF